MFPPVLRLLIPEFRERLCAVADAGLLRRFSLKCLGLGLACLPEASRDLKACLDILESEVNSPIRNSTLQMLEVLLDDATESVSKCRDLLDDTLGALHRYHEADLYCRLLKATRDCASAEPLAAAACAAFEVSTNLGKRARYSQEMLVSEIAAVMLTASRPPKHSAPDDVLEGLLDEVPIPVALLIRDADDQSLRSFACRCAHMALDSCSRSMPSDASGFQQLRLVSEFLQLLESASPEHPSEIQRRGVEIKAMARKFWAAAEEAELEPAATLDGFLLSLRNRMQLFALVAESAYTAGEESSANAAAGVVPILLKILDFTGGNKVRPLADLVDAMLSPH